MSKYITNYGQWAVDEIKVHIITDTFAIIKYEMYIVNAYKHEKNVRLNFINRLKGITLEQKIDEKFNELKSKLIQENEKIKARQQIEGKYN